MRILIFTSTENSFYKFLVPNYETYLFLSYICLITNNSGAMAYDEHLADRIHRALRERHIAFNDVKMMGGLVYMVNDKMCIGVIKHTLMARVDPEIFIDALLRPHCHPMDFTGRTMKGYIVVEPEGVDADADLDYWIDLALEFTPRAHSSKTVKKK